MKVSRVFRAVCSHGNPTRHALESAQRQPEYQRCWQGLQKHFDPTRR